MTEKTNNNEANTKRAPYEAPAIIYEGLITTRCGSSVFDSSPEIINPADPANIFRSGT